MKNIQLLQGHSWYWNHCDSQYHVLKCHNCNQKISKKIIYQGWNINNLIDCKTKQAELKMDEALK